MNNARANEPGFRAIYTIKPDGTNAKLLVSAPDRISSATPEWSHDGTRVAFDAVRELERLATSHIFLYHLKGSRAGETIDLGPGNVPTWSPDDHHIAFLLNSGNPSNARPGIWIMKSDGSDRMWLCDGSYPQWSPDGTQICVEDMAAQPNCLGLYQIQTGEYRRILGQEWSVDYAGANWSPDSRELVFIGRHADREHLAICDARLGEAKVTILYTEEDVARKLIGPPAWSPDGQQIVIAIQDPNPPQLADRSWLRSYLYVCSSQAPTTPKLLEANKVGLINRGMMWSPDSQLIIFSSER